MTTRTGATLLTAALVLLVGAGCDSSDDDGDMAGGPDPTTPDPMTPAPADDVLDIVALGDTDEPARLDRAALEAQLGTLLGDENADPLAIEDDDTALTALQRRRQQNGDI